MIHVENNVLTDELIVAGGQLKKSKYAYLYVPNEHPRGFRVLKHV